MSRLLSELLHASEPLFSIALQQLERGSGNPGVDVRLTAEIIGKTHLKSRALGLDPRDTTGRELYHALLGLVAKHDEFLAQKLGAKDPSDVQDVLPRVVQMVSSLATQQEVWALKHSSAKKLLKLKPPKKVMKQLGYRSVDSLLKRENASELYGAIRFLESPDWLKDFLQSYQKLQPSDFEVRKLEVKQLRAEKWHNAARSYIREKRHNIVHSKELGVVYVLPVEVHRIKGLTVTVFPLLLHYVNELRTYSTYFKMQQMKPDFGKKIVETLTTDSPHHATIAGFPIHWRIIHRYFGSSEAYYHPEVFEPHIQPEDLSWHKAEEVLYRIEPALHFWHDMDYVAVMADGKPVSFNLIDVAANYVNNVPYEARLSYHFRDALWNEIYVRYIGQQTFKHQLLEQLGDQSAVPQIMEFNYQKRG